MRERKKKYKLERENLRTSSSVSNNGGVVKDVISKVNERAKVAWTMRKIWGIKGLGINL